MSRVWLESVSVCRRWLFCCLCLLPITAIWAWDLYSLFVDTRHVCAKAAPDRMSYVYYSSRADTYFSCWARGGSVDP